MGTVLLIVALVIEAGLTAYCIMTRSSHKRLRSIVRVAAFVGFVALAAVSVVRWTPLWYALTLLLLVWAVLGAVALARRRPDARAYRGRRVVGRGVLALVLVLVALSPTLVFPDHRTVPTTGEYTIGTETFTLTDTSRTETYTTDGQPRRLGVELWYPSDAHGTYPLVVFSHGAMGIKSSNTSLYRELASHGYVVAAIDHTFQALYATLDDGRTTWIDSGYMNQIMKEDAHKDRQQAYLYYQEWMTVRMGDINVVIDTILDRTRDPKAGAPYTLVDPTEIGVVGHSLGGSAALGIGRVRSDVDAVISLEAPFMYDIEGTSDGQFVWNKDPYPTPVLNVYAEIWSHLGEYTQYAENFALLSDTSGTAFSVYITGANHFSLTDLALESPFLTTVLGGSRPTKDAVECLTIVNKVSLAFLDTYLKGKGAFTAAGTY